MTPSKKATVASLQKEIAALAERLNTVISTFDTLHTNEQFLNSLADIIVQRLQAAQNDQQKTPSTFYKLSPVCQYARSLRVTVGEDDAPVVQIRNEASEWVSTYSYVDGDETVVIDLATVDLKAREGMLNYCKQNLPDAKEWFVTVYGKESPFPAYRDNNAFEDSDTGMRIKFHGADELLNPNGATLVIPVDGQWAVLGMSPEHVAAAKASFDAYNTAHPDAVLTLDRYHNIVIFDVAIKFEDFVAGLRDERAAKASAAYIADADARKVTWFSPERFTDSNVKVTINRDEQMTYTFTDVDAGEPLPLHPADIAMVQRLMVAVLDRAPDTTSVYLTVPMAPAVAAGV